MIEMKIRHMGKLINPCSICQRWLDLVKEIADSFSLKFHLDASICSQLGPDISISLLHCATLLHLSCLVSAVEQAHAIKSKTEVEVFWTTFNFYSVVMLENKKLGKKQTNFALLPDQCMRLYQSTALSKHIELVYRKK